MKIPKDKYKILINCLDGCRVEGCIHVPQGLRMLDYLNDEKEGFVPVTEAKIRKKEVSVIMLNKNAIKWVEEIN